MWKFTYEKVITYLEIVAWSHTCKEKREYPKLRGGSCSPLFVIPSCSFSPSSFLSFLLPVPSIFLTLNYIRTAAPNSDKDNLLFCHRSFFFSFPSCCFSPCVVLSSPESPWCVLISSVLSCGSALYFSSCFPFFCLRLSFFFSLVSESRAQSFLFFPSHFSDRQPLIHVPIIPSAWGPLSQAQKTRAVKHLCLFSLQSFLLLSSAVSVFFPHLSLSLLWLYCWSCPVRFFSSLSPSLSLALFFPGLHLSSALA